MIAVVTASTLIAYSRFTPPAPRRPQRLGTTRLGLTIPFVLYGIFRYLYLVHQKRGGGSPAAMLLTDRPLLACVALWVASGGAHSVFAARTVACRSRSTTRRIARRRTSGRTARVSRSSARGPKPCIEDYARVMDLAGYRDTLSRDRDTLLKLNLSWTKYFPSCSSQPWQVDGVVGKMLADGFERASG